MRQTEADGSMTRRIINPPYLSDIFKTLAAFQPAMLALEYDGTAYTYEQLEALANRAANYFISRGLNKGDRVAWIATNIDLFWPIFVGAAKAGAVLAPLNWRLAQSELSEILSDMEPALILSEPEFHENTRAVADNLSAPSIRLDEAFRTQLALESITPISRPRDTKDVVLQLYTSGTTGLPKGVLLTHQCFHEVTAAQQKIGAIKPRHADETSLHVLPHFHIAGVTLGFMAWRQSMPVIQHSRFDIPAILEEAGGDIALNAFFVPSMIEMLLTEASNAEVSLHNFVCVSYGAAPMPAALLARAIDLMPNAKFYQFYGMTETTGGVSVLNDDDHYLGSPVLSSAGVPLPGCRVKIIEPATGREVGPGEVGEIFSRSRHIMPGYWRREDATSQVLSNGYYRSGDAGYKNEAGYLFLVDRLKDMIISGGENIYPAELERVLLQHSAIAECACYGIPDKKWGEVVSASIALTPGRQLQASSVKEFLRGKIANFKMPHHISFIDALPRNASGKVQKTVLRQTHKASLKGL